MVRLKSAHRHWGPRKIRALYARLHSGADVPSESSFKPVLERAGLTERGRIRSPWTPNPRPLSFLRYLGISSFVIPCPPPTAH